MQDFLIIHIQQLQVIIKIWILKFFLGDYSNVEQISIRQTNPNTSINNDVNLNTDNIILEEKKDFQQKK